MEYNGKYRGESKELVRKLTLYSLVKYFKQERVAETLGSQVRFSEELWNLGETSTKCQWLLLFDLRQFVRVMYLTKSQRMEC